MARVNPIPRPGHQGDAFACLGWTHADPLRRRALVPPRMPSVSPPCPPLEFHCGLATLEKPACVFQAQGRAFTCLVARNEPPPPCLAGGDPPRPHHGLAGVRARWPAKTAPLALLGSVRACQSPRWPLLAGALLPPLTAATNASLSHRRRTHAAWQPRLDPAHTTAHARILLHRIGRKPHRIKIS